MEGASGSASSGLARLVVAVLGPCVALLCLLNGLLLLRLGWRRTRRRGPCPGPGPRRRAWASPAAPTAPPNSPADSWTAAGSPEGAAGLAGVGGVGGGPRRQAPAAGPFEYGSSIRRSGGAAGLDSAHFSASPGPGLDSDFGASAGVSLRILSSDSEESPARRPPGPRPAGRFEWDYYDPAYASGARLPPHLPPLCSKQYWL